MKWAFLFFQLFRHLATKSQSALSPDFFGVGRQWPFSATNFLRSSRLSSNVFAGVFLAPSIQSNPSSSSLEMWSSVNLFSLLMPRTAAANRASFRHAALRCFFPGRITVPETRL